MKNVITVLLSIFITILLILMGISLGSKNLIIETADVLIKDEVTKKIVETVESTTNMSREELEEKITESIDNNPRIKEFVSNYFDKFMGLLNDEVKLENIDIENEVKTLLDESESILSKYGVTITDEMKNEIMDFVKSDETNDLINSTVEDIKTNIPKTAKTALKSFTFFISLKFQMLCVSLIVVFLLIIALIKKSYYNWIINLSVPTLITGIIFTPSSILVNSLLINSKVSIGVLTIYGIINLVLGVTLAIVNGVIVKNKKEVVTN